MLVGAATKHDGGIVIVEIGGALILLGSMLMDAEPATLHWMSVQLVGTRLSNPIHLLVGSFGSIFRSRQAPPQTVSQFLMCPGVESVNTLAVDGLEPS